MKKSLQTRNKIISLLWCILMLYGILAMPVSALSYYATYYSEAIYAGGVVDLYAYPSEGETEDFTYQWQYDVGIGDGHWYDVEDNGKYSGAKTNHLRLYTSTGNYDGWEEIPFQCVITAPDGTVRRTDNIYMHIYPTDKLIPDMKYWGYGLYTPSIPNATGLYTKDDVNYTASICAGTKTKIFCGSKPVADKPILHKSEVELTTEIHIKENGKTTVSGNSTSYIPYTVGKMQVQIKEKLTIGGHDLGYFDTKTVDITVVKPQAINTGTAKSDCSLLRYTYNESQKLASISKGTSLEIVGEEGSYYQVYYNGYVGYVGKSLLNSGAIATGNLITNVDVTIPKPVAGQTPASTCTVDTAGCELYKIEPVTWTDASGKFIKSTDKFQEGQKYTVSIWVAAKSGYAFQTDAYGNPKLTGAINGNLPPFINKAYEQDPKEVIELTYTFAGAQAAPEATEPPLTTTPTEPAHIHTPSGWRTTGAYHYKACTTCGDFLEQEDHRGGIATCSAKGKCTVCGYAYIEENENHNPDTSQWTACGNLYHAHLCKLCGAHCDIGDHVEGPTGTPDAAVVCKDCGYIIKPAKDHKHNLTQVQKQDPTCTEPGNLEYYTCDGCSDFFTDSEGTAKVTDTVIAPLGHTISEEWQFDVNNHWRTCTTCKSVLAETQMAHEMIGEKCATCSYAGTTSVTDPDEAPGAETTAHTVPQAPDPGSDGTPRWLLLLIGLLAVAAGVVGGMLILRNKKKEK